MHSTTYFNIHNIVRFRITTRGLLPRLLSQRLIREYDYFQTDHLDEVDFAVEIGSFEPANDGCHVLEDRQYFVKEGYFYCEDSYKLAKWAVELSSIDSGVTRVRIEPNLFGYLFVGGYIIDFLLRFNANKKGVPFVHGSALSKDGKAYLFPARSGSGKTVLAMKLLEKGYNLLGDNFVMLDNGRVLSYPSRMNIFFYNLAPPIRKRLGAGTLFFLWLKYLLYRLSFGYAKIFTPVSVQQIFAEKIRDEARLNKVFLLLPTDAEPGVEALSREDLIASLVLNNKLDGFPFHNYALEYAYIFPESDLATHWVRLAENYRRALGQGASCFKATISDESIFDTLERLSVLQG